MATAIPQLDLNPARQAGFAIAGGDPGRQALAEAQGESLGANTQNAIEEAHKRQIQNQALRDTVQAYKDAYKDHPELANANATAATGGLNPQEIASGIQTGRNTQLGDFIANRPNTPAADVQATHYAQAISPQQLASPFIDANGNLIRARATNLDVDSNVVKPAVAAEHTAGAALKTAEAANNPHVGAVVGPNGQPKAPTGFQWAVKADGSPVLDDQGQPTLRPITGGAKDPEAPASATGREAIFNNRVFSAGNQAAASLANIARGSIGQSAGTFGIGAAPGHSALASTVDSLRNRLSSDEVQQYNVMNTALARNLNALESQGLAQGAQAFTDQLGQGTTLRAGDTEQTKLLRMAESRQIAERALTPKLQDPRISKAQKAMVQDILGQLRDAIPYSVEDVQGLSAAPPGTSLADIAKAHGLTHPAAPRVPGASGAAAAPTGGAPVGADGKPLW